MNAIVAFVSDYLGWDHEEVILRFLCSVRSGLVAYSSSRKSVDFDPSEIPLAKGKTYRWANRLRHNTTALYDESMRVCCFPSGFYHAPSLPPPSLCSFFICSLFHWGYLPRKTNPVSVFVSASVVAYWQMRFLCASNWSLISPRKILSSGTGAVWHNEDTHVACVTFIFLLFWNGWKQAVT